MEMFGIKAGFMPVVMRAAFKAESELATRLAEKMTKAELLAAHPGPGLQKFSKACLVMRAVTLHMAQWEQAQEAA